MAKRRRKDYTAPPTGELWAWLSLELLASIAWRRASQHCRKFIEYLILQHFDHGRNENGNLMATYDQLRPWGIRQVLIHEAIEEAIFLGLVVRTQEGRNPLQMGGRAPAKYRLTFYGEDDTTPATNEWKRHEAREEIHATTKATYKDKTIRPGNEFTLPGREDGTENIKAWQKDARAARRTATNGQPWSAAK